MPSSHTAQLGFVLDAWDAGVRPPGSGREARDTLEFAAALYKAAFTGRVVRAGEIGPGDAFYEAMHGGFGGTWRGSGRGSERGSGRGTVGGVGRD